LLSYNNEKYISQKAPIYFDDAGRSDVLCRFPFIATPLPVYNSISSSHSLSHPNHDSKKITVPVNGLGEKNVNRFRDNGKDLERTISSSSFVDLDRGVGLSQSKSEHYNTQSLNTAESASREAITAARDLKVMHSSSSLSTLSLTLFKISIPANVNHVNPWEKRSKQQSTSDLCSLQSSLSSSTSITQKSPAMCPSLRASRKLTPVILNESTVSSSTALHEASTAAQLVAKLLNDVRQPNSRVEQLRRDIRSKEIKYYRQKCVRSLKKSMMGYKKLNSIEDKSIVDRNCDYVANFASIELCHKPNHSRNDRVASAAKLILKLVMETMCFNLVMYLICTRFILWTDSFSNIMTPLIPGAISIIKISTN